MRLTSVHIENFRGLTDISFELPPVAAVIVGPNAIGKSSVLEAIRLAKALLAPTYIAESQQVLNSLGAHIPSLNAFRLDTLVGDISSPLRITLEMALTPEELQHVRERLPQLVQLRIRDMLGNPNADDLALVQYLSSQEGQQRYDDFYQKMGEELKDLEKSRSVELSLEVNPSTYDVRGDNLFHQEVAQILTRSHPPSLGAFTYFPADRAMPSGDVNMQIGSADATAQLYSHLGDPASKYQRLKQHLVNQTLTPTTAKYMENDFAIVFDKLLTGKTLDGLELTPQGMLTVRIGEPESNAVYDIDGMSSGEKGLLLTFFLMKRSTAPGGIILLDEPELHLNPAVTKKILPFLIEQVLKPLHAQAIICTHSPEITADAYEDSQCTLLHLRSSTDITPIHPQDKQEVYDAIRRLGADPSEVMFSHGSIYVEGEDDEELLSTGWPERVSGYKITRLGGRSEVEKAIKTFQADQGQLDNIQCFIFDLDSAQTELSDTDKVKVRQWDRYCFENYLLEPDIIFDVSTANKFTKIPTRGTLPKRIQEIALRQLKGFIAKEVYKKFEPDNPGFRSEVAKKENYTEMADALVARLFTIKGELANLDRSKWMQDFEAQCEALHRERLPQWRKNWQTLANGKLVIEEIFKELGPKKCSLREFKRLLASEMLSKKTKTWQEVDSVLKSALEQ